MRLRVALCLAASTLIISCAGESPEILQLTHQVVLFHDLENQVNQERLSLFAAVDDADGLDDLESLYLIHDKEELYWKLDAENWETSTFQKTTWIGGNSFITADGSVLPRGTYRVLLRDFSGQSFEQTFDFKSESRLGQVTEFPASREQDGRIYVAGDVSQIQIWVYDTDHLFKRSFSMSDKGLSISSVKSRVPEASQYYIYKYDSPLVLGLLTGPYFL